jgi:nucleoside-diphosphate-sugar epimerase
MATETKRKTLTVAVTGPTGDIGKPLLRALDKVAGIKKVIGMARRPFDPSELGLKKTEYRQGDILDKDSVAQLVKDADVVVHLAFIIFGGRDETRSVNLEGTRNVFEAALDAGVERLVYTSSVAAYGFHEDNPQPLTEDTVPRGSDEFYYSAQKAELERMLFEIASDSEADLYVYRPCIVAGPDALAMVEVMLQQLQAGGRLPQVTRFLESVPFLRPVLPDTGHPMQLVHHDDVAAALVEGITGRGEPGIYNLAGDGTIHISDIADELDWYSVPVPSAAVGALAEVVKRIPFAPAQWSWLNAARVPVLMDTAKAREKLGWEPRYDSRETLQQTIAAARAEGLFG